MHTRRLDAMLLGAWLAGLLLMAFVASQARANVERIFRDPPPSISKQIEGATPLTRQVVEFGALKLNRHLEEAWHTFELLIGAALLATAVFTAHRSRFLICGAAIMLSIAAWQSFVAIPEIHRMENAGWLTTAFRVGEWTKFATGLAVAVRLLYDRKDWQNWRMERRRSGRGEQVDTVDYTNNRHINR